MKICHLTSVHPYNDARIFHKECVSLANAGFDVTLIAPVDTSITEQGVTVLPAGSWKNRFSRLFVTIPRLLFQALKQRARIYQIHDPELLPIAPILRLSGAAVVYDIHEDYVTSIPQKSYIPKTLGKPLAHLVGNLESFLSLWCQKVIAEKFPHTSRSVSIADINVEDNFLTLKIIDDQIAKAGTGIELLAIEVTEKPMINMLWLGTILMITGLFISLIYRTRISRL